MFFRRKIKSMYIMEQITDIIENTAWFSSCGLSYEKPSYYQFIQYDDSNAVETRLNHRLNYSGNTSLENLFKEGLCRADAFALETCGWKFYQNEFLKTMQLIWKTYEDAICRFPGLDLKRKERDLLESCRFDPSLKLCTEQLVQYLVLEKVFVKESPQYPVFFSHVFEIYKEGHAVIGWKGRFPSHDRNLEDECIHPISPDEGKLVIW